MKRSAVSATNVDMATAAIWFCRAFLMVLRPAIGNSLAATRTAAGRTTPSTAYLLTLSCEWYRFDDHPPGRGAAASVRWTTNCR
jgi:hypothetical protein